MDETLWPARNIAEYAYCPRLFYYMEVEGIHAPSDDTLEGLRIHQRVDKPSMGPNRNQESADEPPKSIRSLTLTSEKHGITATLDLAEMKEMSVVPVEYRKGRPRYVYESSSKEPTSVTPWPTDRVQVGLQSILLEEAGYTVPEAVLYYAAEKRRVTIAVDDSLRRDALATLSAAVSCANGSRPLPLVNDPRCPRCSLQPICCPDELNAQREPDVSPRKLWPPRDDGIHVIVQQNGTKVGVRGSAMVVSESAGQTIKEVPLAGVESLSLVGSVQISTQAVQTLSDRGIPVAFLTAAGRAVAVIDPLDSVSAATRRAQVRRFDTEEACLELARALIAAKISNQRTLLMRNSSSPSPAVMSDLATQVDSARKAASLDSLRGHEGQAASLYFGNLAGVFSGDIACEFNANGRQRRPAPDPINATLSFAYSMLTHECTAALRVARLEPAIGAFHVSRPGRPALSLDLMEPFRPLISDSIVISAFNRGELKQGHFLRTAAGCMLTDSGRKAFFAVYGRRMADEVTHPVFGYRLSYRRMIILHARMIAAWLSGEIPTLAFLTTR